MIKKLLIILLAVCLTMCGAITVFASDNEQNENIETNSGAENNITTSIDLKLDVKSAVLMEAETGAILYCTNQNERLAPASVTKVMSLLLVAEALKEGKISINDKITISANASKMGGSQIFLKEGEVFTTEELLKSTIIASANDAIVALAEHCYGSEDGFVVEMNKRAEELNMQSTSFENCTGLDDTTTNHLTSALDIAIMSRELIKHEIILKYSCIWQDSIRDGEFILTNTNRLVRYYDGCTGLKTGSTDKAGYCVSATARRDGMHLIAVVMGSETRDQRNEAARRMLDYGFSSYSLYRDNQGIVDSSPVLYGLKDEVGLESRGLIQLIEKGKASKIEKYFELPNSLTAPIKKGDVVGQIIYRIDGEEIGRSDVFINENIERLGLIDIIYRIICSIIVGNV